MSEATLTQSKIQTGPTILLVSNLEASRAYYQNKLGCTHDSCGHTTREGLFLLMYQAENPSDLKPISKTNGGPPWDILVYTNSQEELYEEFITKGAVVHSPLTQSESGWKEFIIEDIDGYRIGFWGLR
ncbi:VOC family protein [Paenibacillus albus]|uniref:VOC family protein n=1 Tax=Paenibacillus albus TaxID=2495582 RepID=A0A3S9A5R0_9BACL|nr:VOC family protein [Paenibacillus albus]AZN41041.1 VOC family protein [Paenibacillus albus]